MSKLKISPREWVVVCDGAKALILENTGDELYPNLKTREVYEQDSAKTREQGTDRPGRVRESASTARSAVEQTDWHDLAERAFLTSLAARLHEAVMSGKTKTLIVVAAPRALGMLRDVYSPHLRKAVRTEIGKDLVKMPVHEIEEHLADHKAP